MKVQISVVVLVFLITSQNHAQNADNGPFKSTGEPRATLVNINNISMWIRNDGWSGRNPWTDEEGIVYPSGTASVVFQDGVIWGGKVQDGKTTEVEYNDNGVIRKREFKIRVGGTNYLSALRPGKIIEKGVPEDTLNPDVRIWRIRRDWRHADLSRDAAEFFNVSEDSVTQGQIDFVGSQYEKDWNQWPWQKGAPFYDNNLNGIMEADEEPGLAFADQVVWTVAHDLDSSATLSFYGSQPIGLELQITLWAYKERTFQNRGILNDTIFKRFRLIYKGTESTPDTAHIDSMYIGIWADTDLGAFADDFLASDTTMNLIYTYNSREGDPEYSKYNLAPPAFGYKLIQGPLIKNDSPESVGRFDFKERPGYSNLIMTAAWLKAAGDGQQDPGLGGDYNGTLQFWNLLRGFYTRPEFPPEPWINPHTGQPTKYQISGDPVAGTGWLDVNPGSRRFVLSTGPFTMALGDTQEVIVAVVGGLGSSRLASVSVMKYHADWAKLLAESNFDIGFEEEETPEPPLPKFFQLHQNYPNPFNPSTEIRYELPAEFRVKLAIFNTLGQQVKTLVNETQEAGPYTVTWDGTNDKGKAVPSGVYFYRIELGRFSETRKMLLVR